MEGFSFQCRKTDGEPFAAIADIEKFSRSENPFFHQRGKFGPAEASIFFQGAERKNGLVILGNLLYAFTNPVAIVRTGGADDIRTACKTQFLLWLAGQMGLDFRHRFCKFRAIASPCKKAQAEAMVRMKQKNLIQWQARFLPDVRRALWPGKRQRQSLQRHQLGMGIHSRPNWSKHPNALQP